MIENRPFLNFFSHAVLIVGVLILVFPVWVTFVASTYDATGLISQNVPLLPGGHFWENYSQVLGSGVTAAGSIPIGTMMFNSLIMALSIAIGKIAISIISAFAIVYFKFPFRMFFFWLIFLTLMLPVEVRILPTFAVATNLNLLNSYAGLSLPLIASHVGPDAAAHWDGRNDRGEHVSSGVYFMELHADDVRDMRRMLLRK